MMVIPCTMHQNVHFLSRVSVWTLEIYSGERLGSGIGTDAITTPMVNTSAYHFKKTSDLIDCKERRRASFDCGRYGNPTTVVAEEKISALDGAESALLLASGMCVSTVMFLALVPAGGHIVTKTDWYRKSRIFIETVLPTMGITVCPLRPTTLKKKRLQELLRGSGLTAFPTKRGMDACTQRSLLHTSKGLTGLHNSIALMGHQVACASLQPWNRCRLWHERGTKAVFLINQGFINE